jgi:hypothetical protein
VNYYARFIKVHNELFRLETQIYLEEMQKIPNKKEGVCVAAIVGKNPGSARPIQHDKWTTLDLEKDKMLPYVRNRFLEGYQLAGKEIPHGAFVRVWNLFYLCNKELDVAIASHNKIASKIPICFTEKKVPKIVWFAWGGSDARLHDFKARFQNLNTANAFFFEKDSRRIVTRIPSQVDFAKHTQGLSKKPIVEHLASVL